MNDTFSNTFYVYIAFALFIVCPRMAGMINIISNTTKINIIYIAIIGTIISIPIIAVMALIFKYYGLIAALGFSVITDFGAALVMRQISFKAGLETLIIAVFLIIGVRVASLISNLI